MSLRAIRAFVIDRGGGVALAALIIYVAIAPSHIVGDSDNAEFATIGAIGGVPHPSGYPAYVLWLRLMSHLPGVTPAHAASIATAILGAATILVLHAACRAWGARPFAATISVGVFAAAPVVLRVYTEAEVFALNCLVVATVVWLSARLAPLSGTRRVVALGFVAGLALSNHMTCVFAAPIGALGVVRGVRESAASRRLVLASTVLAFGVGLLPYAYLLVAPDTPISWRHMTGGGDLLRHFLRLDYGFGTLSPNREPVPAIDQLTALLLMLGRTWLWGPLVFGAVALGGFVLGRDRSRGETRWAWALLATSFLLAGPALVARFNIPPDGIGLVLVHRFHLLPAMLLAIPVAVGTEWVVHRMVEQNAPRTRAVERAGHLLAVGLFFALASRSLPEHSPAVQNAVRNMLRPLPPNAVVIVSEDSLYFGSAYVQLVLGERPDVTVIAWGQLLNPEYRQRLRERSGIVALTPGDKFASTAIANDVLRRGLSMFVDSTKNQVLQTFPSYPFGSLFRVLPPGSPRPPIADVFAENKAIYESFDLDYPRPTRDDDYAAHEHERYARIWSIIARALAADGKREEAATADAFADALLPRP